MGKLIIRHGERRTEHELSEESLEIGRDPECELFFADRKLSRRHARIERDAGGFLIVDLGSRNGSWVNEERVDQRRLVSGDEIRLGDVLLSFLHEDEPISHDEEPTVYLGNQGSDDTATIVLNASGSLASRDEFSRFDDSSKRTLASGDDPRGTDDSSTQLLPKEHSKLASDDAAEDSSTRILPMEPPDRDETSTADDSSTQLLPREQTYGAGNVADDSSTRVLPADPFEESEQTLQKPEGRAAGGEQTVLGSGESGVGRMDTGTVLFRGESQDAPDQSTGESGSRDGASQRFSGASWGTHPQDAGSWTLRFGVTVSILVLFAVVVLAVPLYSTTSRALEEESQSRARTLMELLAALNQGPLGEGRLQDASVVAVEHAPGVRRALVLDATGRIVAPSSSAGEIFSVDGLGVPPQSVRSIRSGKTPTGDSVVAGPIIYRGRRVGVALIIRRSTEGASVFALLIGLALVLIAIAATIIVTGRMTLVPLEELHRDIESLEREDGSFLGEARPYEQVSNLARAVNRLISSSSHRASSHPTGKQN